MVGRPNNRQGGWPDYPKARPRKVEGGITAKTARGVIGSSWWSRRFLTVLESLAMGGRLTRGRTYARQGQVISLEVNPGVVAARVQGSRARPYDVVIGLREFDADVWNRAEVALAEQALLSAKLLAGEVPPELDDIFTAAGAPLFPRSTGDLAQDCSCPDHEVPCKHLAATFYLLAEAFDEDPFLVLKWRGRDREKLLSRLRELRTPDAADAAVAATAAPLAPTFGAAAVLAGLELPSVTPDRFWAPPPPLPPRTPTFVTDADLLLRQLPAPPPALGGESLAERLSVAYQRFAEWSG